MLISLQRWGNSQGIRIPKSILESLDINFDTPLELQVQATSIILRKQVKRKTIEELFANFDGEYQSQEVDWGQKVGKEVW